MKFLVDQQLPPSLARFLQSQGHEAAHVRELGLKEADDLTLWRHAAVHDLVIVSKDEDFYFLATSPSDDGRLVWVRLGNCRTKALIETFRTRLPQVVAALEAGSRVVEIR